ncbi:MAG: hypothetical protein ABFC96_02185 [Thermoguttaceae bacterium]
MGSKKQNTSRSVSTRLLGRGRRLLAVLAVAGLIVAGAVWAWRSLAPRILGSPEFRLTAEQIEITPPPEWIHSDIRGEVFRAPTLDGPLSLMDDDLAKRISDAFARHPWVAKVNRVDLHRRTVELVYRRPVCMVEVTGVALPLPVDGEGTLLPTDDFSPVEAASYPLLSGVERGPTGPPGSHWADAKVVGGAEIAAVIRPAWAALGLQRIVPLATDPTVAAVAGQEPPATGRRSGEPFFMLVTRRGTQVLWGYAPGANAMGELPAAQKLARLQRYVNNNDSLDGPNGQRQVRDVRTMRDSL